MILRYLLRDTAVYGGADFASKVIAFLAFPMIAAALSPLEFGALELMLTATTLLGMVANCGLNNALQRFYWDEQTVANQKPILVSSGLAALSVLLFFSLVFGIIAVFLYHYSKLIETTPLGLIGLLSGLILMVAGQLVQYLLDVTRLHMAPWRFVCIALISRVTTAVAGVVVVVWLGWGLDGLLVAQALVMVVAIPPALYAVRADLTCKVDIAVAGKLMRFGYPFIYAGLAFWLFGSMDRWLLARISGVDEVGIYSVAYRFSSVILFVSLAFGQAWSPLAIKIRSDNPQSYRSLYVDVLLALLSVMILLGGGIALFSPEIIKWLMPVEYHGASLVLSALALGLILQSTMQITAIGISLEKKTSLFARVSWMAAGINLILNLIMIPPLGALGAAVATSLSYLFLTGAYLYYTQILHPLPIPWDKIFVLLALWIAMAVCLIGFRLNYAIATSVFSRGLLMFVIFLVCAAVLPWRRAFRMERNTI